MSSLTADNVNRACPQFVDDRDCVGTLLNSVKTHLLQTDAVGGTDRVPVTVVSRCSRGGKTTALARLYSAIARDSLFADVIPLFVDCNGSSGLNVTNDTTFNVLLRAIARALLPATTEASELQSLAHHGVVTEAAVIDAIGDRPVVLLIDEINRVFHNDPSPDQGASRKDACAFLRDHFVTKAGRYLVMTTHVSSVTFSLANDMDWTSNRPCHVIGLPIASDVAHLRTIRHLEAVTECQATAFSFIPGLVVSHRQQPGAIQQRFDKVDPACGTLSAALAVRELLTSSRTRGSPMRVFDELLDDGRWWIPCYLAQLLDHEVDPTLGSWMTRLLTEEGPGKPWEYVALTAIGLRWLDARLHHNRHLFLYCEMPAAGFHVQFWDTDASTVTIDTALASAKLNPSHPTVYVFRCSNPTFHTYDAFTVQYPNAGAAGPGNSVITGYQMKFRLKQPASPTTPTHRLDVKTKVWLEVSGLAPSTSPSAPAGWFVVNDPRDLCAFLGPSLSRAIPVLRQHVAASDPHRGTGGASAAGGAASAASPPLGDRAAALDAASDAVPDAAPAAGASAPAPASAAAAASAVAASSAGASSSVP